MNENLCMGCMENKGDLSVCPYCGYSESAPRIQSCLAPRSLIGGRYLVGKVLSYNGEGVTYIGYDTVSDRKVAVREFFPEALVTRAADGRSVEIRPNCQIQFKTYLSDFLEVNEKIAHLRSISSLAQILDITEDCETVYAISEYPLGETLEQFLQRRGMMLTWGETYDLMMPVIRTMQLIHEDGIIHRGISPSTLYITSSGKAKLSGFGISAVRAARTELTAELFPGFSAPEQYSTTSPHGTWTDIYAICAVLYLCVTGIAPPEALIRSPETGLIRPRERNETVPTKVSSAILQGLSIRPDDRIRTIPELSSRLLPSKAVAGGDAPTVAIPAIPSGTAEKAHTDAQPRYPDTPVRHTPAQSGEPPRTQRNTGSRPAVNGQRSASQQRNNMPGNMPAQRGNAQQRGNAPQRSGNIQQQRSQRPVQGNHVSAKEAEKKKERNVVLTAMFVTLPILLIILIFTFWFLFGGKDSNKDSYKNSIVTSDSTSDDGSSSSGFGNYTPPVSSSSSDSDSQQSSEESSSEPSSESSSEPSSESSEESSEPTWSMIQLVGRQLEEVQQDGEVTGHITIDSNIEFVYSESAAQGEIIWQDIAVGTPLEKGAIVRIKVSRGSQYVVIPDWEKCSQEEYEQKLNELSIPYKVEKKISTDYPSGYVIGTDHMAGTKYDLESGTTITIYVCENNQSY